MELAALLAQSDFVICLAIANEQTENLMNAAAFAAMKPIRLFHQYVARQSGGRGSACRGARCQTHRRRRHGCRPRPDQKPSLALAARADVIATPHIAGLTPDAAEHQAFDTVNQVKELLAGRMPPGAANAEAASRLRLLKRG